MSKWSSKVKESLNKKVEIKLFPLVCIQTDRLIIQQTNNEDLDDFIKLYSDAKVMEKYSDGKVRDRERVKRMIDINVKRWEQKNYYSSLSIFNKETKDFIGQIFISTYERDDKTAILGIILHEKFWGQSYGKEAVYNVVHHYIPFIRNIKSQEEIREIVAYSRTDNIPSQKILENSGFELSDKVKMFGAERFRFVISTENLIKKATPSLTSSL